MADSFDIDSLNTVNRFAVVGHLNSETVNFLKENCNCNDIINKITENNILFWYDRVEHIKKHKSDFWNDYEFDYYIEKIPDIIEGPDYLGIPNHDNSIQFFRVSGTIVSVAVRVASSGKLSFRTLYPISREQLDDYVDKKRAWKFY